jgi:hypothetical protein
VSSIPKLAATFALGLVVLGVGCVKKEATVKAPLDNRQLPSDEAMKYRSWPESEATYANTAVQAGPDRFPYEAKNPNYGVWLDTPLFLVNSVVLPFTYFKTGASDEISNQTGGSIGNGYTAVPDGAYYMGPGLPDYSGRTQPSQTGGTKQGSVGGPQRAQGSVGGGSGGTGGK